MRAGSSPKAHVATKVLPGQQQYEAQREFVSDDDVAVLDAYVKKAHLPSRSAGLQRAVRMLRYPELENDYAEAWGEWATDDDGAAWDSTVGDGIPDAAR